MNKRILSVLFVMCLLIGTAGTGRAAKSIKCIVDGETVTMTKSAEDLKVGDKVKVRASNAAAIEGC